MKGVALSQCSRLVVPHGCVNRTRPEFLSFSGHGKLSVKNPKFNKNLKLNIKAQANFPTMDARSGGEVAKPIEETLGHRKIVFAVDGTSDAEEGLRWLVKQIARKGDTIHLAHVIPDPRTPATELGSSTAGSQWTPSRDESVYAREYFLRKEHEAQSMMASRFIPSLQFTGIEHKVDLLRLKLHKSAAGIGEALSNHAANIGADLLVIASHGAGVLADYGSVARWCSENSQVPALLLPPAVLQAGPIGVPSNSILVAAVDDLEGLKDNFQFAVRQFTRPGDNIYVVHAAKADTEEEQIAARKDLVRRVADWQNEIVDVHYALTLNVAVELVTEPFSVLSSVDDSASSSSESEFSQASSPAAARLCMIADDINARAVVLRHYGRSMMREMMCGPVTLCCTKFCTRPLIVVGNGASSNA